MGRMKKEYQEWCEHHFPQEVAHEVKGLYNNSPLDDAWIKQFEEVLTRLLSGNNLKSEDKDE